MHRQISALEEVFKLLGNRKRLEILHLLKKRHLSVNDMAAMLGMNQPNLSQHLTMLRQYKLVEVRRHRQKAYYFLADNKITKAVDMVYQFLQEHHGLEAQALDELMFPIVKDPVCGMRLSAVEAFDSVKAGGRVYYFCASGCLHKFKALPSRLKTVKA